MIISASRLEKRTHFRVCVFFDLHMSFAKIYSSWKLLGLLCIMWVAQEFCIPHTPVESHGGRDSVKRCRRSWTIPVQQMSFGVQHSLCEVHLFLILRIPKSWGTPKSCISIGLSIIHKAIGVPPIYGSIHIDQQTVQWNLGVSHTKQLLSPMMKLRGRLHNAWTRDSRNLSGSWNRSL